MLKNQNDLVFFVDELAKVRKHHTALSVSCIIYESAGSTLYIYAFIYKESNSPFTIEWFTIEELLTLRYI